MKNIFKVFHSLKKKNLKELLNDKKIVFVLIASVCVFIIFIWLIFKFAFSNFEEKSPLDSVPVNAAIIFDVKQADLLWDELSENSNLWHNLANIDPFKKINNDIIILDSVLKLNKNTSDILNDHSILISLHQLPDKAMGALFMTSLAKTCGKTEVEKNINKIAGLGVVKTERKFLGSLIYELQLNNKNENFSYTFSNDIFICSFHASLIEEAVKQQKSGVSLAKNPDFVKISGTAGKNVNANIYLNFKYFPPLFSLLVNDKYSKIIGEMSDFANWTAFDLYVKNDALLLNGFTQLEDNKLNFLALFAEQEPHEIYLSKLIPTSTTSIICYSFSDFDLWYKSYLNYLDKNGKLSTRNSQIAKLNSKYKTDVEKNIIRLIGAELALVLTEPSDSAKNVNMFAIIKTKNIDNAIKLLSSQSLLLEQKTITPSKKTKKIKQKKKKNIKSKKAKEKIKVQHRESSVLEVKEVKSEKIYEYKIPEILPLLFGNLFNGVNGKYYAIIEDYVVFGNSINSLKSFLKDYSDNKTLQNNNDYNNFIKNISDESNVYLYCNIKKSLAVFDDYANKDIVSYIKNNSSLFKKFDVFSCQFKTEGNLFYSNICFKTNSTVVNQSNALWSTVLDSTVLNCPKIVNDLSDKSKKIIAFDNACNAYLLDNKGEIIWKEKLKEKPISDVFEVDLFDNKKVQYVFNTQSYIYALNSNGTTVENFPVYLPEASTAPMIVVDYSNKKEYRLIIPCGKMLYNYSKEGTLTKGWNIFKTKSDINKNLTYLRYNDTDCILISDEIGNVYIANRKGLEEIEIKNPLTVSAYPRFYVNNNSKGKSCVLTTDNTGNIIFISSKGEIEKKSIAKFSPAHFFLFEDFNNDKAKEYIFVDSSKLYVYNKDAKLICSYTFDSSIETQPSFFNKISNKSAIGTISTNANKIFLIKNDGTLKDGFPINGSTPFTIGNLNNDGTLNLLVGFEQTIFNYAYH